MEAYPEMNSTSCSLLQWYNLSHAVSVILWLQHNSVLWSLKMPLSRFPQGNDWFTLTHMLRMCQSGINSSIWLAVSICPSSRRAVHIDKTPEQSDLYFPYGNYSALLTELQQEEYIFISDCQVHKKNLFLDFSFVFGEPPQLHRKKICCISKPSSLFQK